MSDDAVLVEGPAALDTIIHTFAPKFAETWPGDEALVGMISKRESRSELYGRHANEC